MRDSNRNREAVGILRGIKDRVEALEQAVQTSEGVPNLLRLVTDGSTGDDAVDARENDEKATDQSTTGDAVDARENDEKATDGSTGDDAVTATSAAAGGWTWDQSNYDFDDWG